MLKIVASPPVMFCGLILTEEYKSIVSESRVPREYGQKGKLLQGNEDNYIT
jgi:hypothetical protein